jgi:hypothetical protein
VVINLPIDNVTTSGTTPIVSGWGPGSSMSSADNSVIYFHPFGTFPQIATAIAGAFNTIEDRSYDAIAIGADVVIRMRNGQSASNNFFMMAQLTLTNELYFQSVQYAPSTQFPFEGGTDSATIRLKFPLADLDILSAGNVYIKTARGISEIAFAGRYVDEAVTATGSSEIGGLNGYADYGALYITDKLDRPVVTTVGDFIAYNLYEVPLGLFSIFAVKDMDGDFFSSNYGISPINEVYRYFDIQADTPAVFVTGRKYLVKSDNVGDSISYLGSTITVSPTIPSNGTMFTAGYTPAELAGVGEGLFKTYSYTVLYAPIEPGSVSISLVPSGETFSDNGLGILTGSIGGTGTVDYTTGLVNATFYYPVPNLTDVMISYNSNSQAPFTVATGTPIVVAQIFYAQAILSTDTLDPAVTYMLYGDPTTDSILDKNTYISYTATYAGTPVAFVGPSPGGRFIYYGTPLLIDPTNFVVDADLKTFSGFFQFKDIVDVGITTNTSTVLFSNRNKFIDNDIEVEYDYLKENFSVEEAVNSRIFKRVAKWVYQGGDDIRDNPYRLNTLPVFGAMSYSPSSLVKVQNPLAFTHEWPYLEQPPQQYVSGLLSDNYYFFYDKLDLTQLQNANPASADYFTDYFTFQSVPNTPDQERYDIFSYNAEIGLCEVFFRGVKMRIKPVAPNTQSVQVGTKPPFIANSTAYAGYKFSVLLRTIKQDPTTIQSPVLFNIIENQTHKTILFLIDVVVEDYRTLSFLNPDDLGTYLSPEIDYPDMLNTQLDYLLMYSLKSKKTEVLTDNSASSFIVGLDGNDYGDVKLSVGIDASSPSGLIGNYTLMNVFSNPAYDWDVRDELHTFNAENIFTGSFEFGPTLFPYAIKVNQSQIFFGVTGYNYAQAPVPYPNFYAPYDFATMTGSTIFIPYGSDFDWEGFPWTQVHGGASYFEPIMQRIAYANIAEKINTYSPYINYTTYSWDSTTNATVASTNQFYLEVADPVKITMTSAVVPQIDTDKPQEFASTPIIGVTYSSIGYYSEIYRHSGPYEPKFDNIIYFAEQKTDSIVEAGINLGFMQTTLNPNVDGFGFVNNLGYMKVAYTDVLTLANNAKYPPRYPLLNETPVDYRDYFTFQSSWDPGFYRLYTTKANYTPQAGSRNMTELKNFFGTKLMKTDSTVRLQDWNVVEVPSVDLITASNIDNYSGEIIYAVVNGVVQAWVNVRARLIRFLIADGADGVFSQYLLPQFCVGNPASFDDTVTAYLTANVLPTYMVQELDLYIKTYAQTLSLPIVQGTLSDAQKLQNGYIEDQNFTSTAKGTFVYYFQYTLSPSANVSLAPSITVGKISEQNFNPNSNSGATSTTTSSTALTN